MAKKIDKTNILLENIVNAIQDVKGKEIISLDLRKIETAICKYFVICTGTSSTHVNAIEGNIKKVISKGINNYYQSKLPCGRVIEVPLPQMVRIHRRINSLLNRLEPYLC